MKKAKNEIKDAADDMVHQISGSRGRPPKSTIGTEVWYKPNETFSYFRELQDLVLKSSAAERADMAERALRVGKIKLIILAGVFVRPSLKIIAGDDIDMLIVGDDLDKKKMTHFLKSVEADVGREIQYVIMEKDEFQYRLSMFDRFIRKILDSPHEKILNKLDV